MMRRLRAGACAAAAGFLILSPQMASAQALSCTVPARLPPPNARASDEDARPRQVPTTGYTLALSWSPQHCRERGRERANAFQCGGSASFGFVLHGLWPDGRAGTWPQYCRTARALPEAVVRRNLCMTPSVDLLQREWARHGTCMTDQPDRYFDTARQLYQRLRYPDMDALSRRRALTVAEFRRAFAAANRHIPRLPERAIRVRLNPDGWLDELWLCLDSQRAYAECRADRTPGNPPTDRMRIWRGS